MLDIFEAAKAAAFGVFISPHYFYPTDHTWLFNGPLEIRRIRAPAPSPAAGALEPGGVHRLGRRLARGVQALHRGRGDGRRQPAQGLRGPQTNDLVLQLRKRGITKVILGGMLANMCVESHLRDLLEQGFRGRRRPRRHRRPAAPRRGATATRPHWSTTHFSPTPSSGPKRLWMPCRATPATA